MIFISRIQILNWRVQTCKRRTKLLL